MQLTWPTALFMLSDLGPVLRQYLSVEPQADAKIPLYQPRRGLGAKCRPAMTEKREDKTLTVCENPLCGAVLSHEHLEVVRWAAGEFVPCPPECTWGRWLSRDQIDHGSRFVWSLRQV
jgi:hypothetical protein